MEGAYVVLSILPKEILRKEVYTSNSYTDFLLSQLRRDWIVEPELDFGWKQDQEVYKKIRLDPRYRAVEETLLLEIAALEWNLSEGDPRVTPAYKWGLDQISGFADSRVNMARGVIEGMSVQKVEGAFVREKIDGDTVERKWWVPKKLRHVPRDKLRRSIHMDSKGRQWWRWNLFNAKLNKWLPILDESKFVWSFYRASEENLGYGDGLGKAAYNLLKLKVVLQELLAAGAERWVDSWVTIKLDETLQSEKYIHNDEALSELIELVAKARAHGILAYQGADLGTMAGATGTTSQTILDMIEKIDREITILLTAVNLPTDVGDVGAYAAVQGQMEQQNKRLLFQRKSLIEEPLNDWLVWCFYKHNRHNGS